MKIRCRNCKTIYDNKEKYCPYCFARTHPRPSHIRVDGTNVEMNTENEVVYDRKELSENNSYRLKGQRKNKNNYNSRNRFSKLWREVLVPLIAFFIFFAVLFNLFI